MFFIRPITSLIAITGVWTNIDPTSQTRASTIFQISVKVMRATPVLFSRNLNSSWKIQPKSKHHQVNGSEIVLYEVNYLVVFRYLLVLFRLLFFRKHFIESMTLRTLKKLWRHNNSRKALFITCVEMKLQYRVPVASPGPSVLQLCGREQVSSSSGSLQATSAHPFQEDRIQPGLLERSWGIDRHHSIERRSNIKIKISHNSF